METLKFNLSAPAGEFKILNATNGGPWHKRHANDQYRSNFEDYKAARMPYSRNHDSGMVMVYGGPYSHDVLNIFPNFDADENDPSSYDFACTDENILCTLEAGTKTFFRLGQTIEHQIKKHNVVPPKDFEKWTRICEHIIMHYTEGWADGFELDMPYWEIWNEPECGSVTWTGTPEQFYDLYATASNHLKARFPHLKIGGPALAWNEEWADDFLAEMKKRGVTFDFFSWHIYCTEPRAMIEKAERIKKLLIKYGYENTESILNEWNYVKGWVEEYLDSIKTMHGMKGASFTMACICEAQKSPNIDMLMYYDTRPSVFCGAFDFYTYEKLKGYYPLMWYGKFYDADAYIKCETDTENIYTLCGVQNGKAMCVITHYSDDDSTSAKDVCIDFGKQGNYEIYLLDNEHDGELIKTTDKLEFTMENQTAVFIKEI